MDEADGKTEEKSNSLREQAKAAKIYGGLVAIDRNSPLSCWLSSVRKSSFEARHYSA
jgi:hypothetical protein